MFPYYWEVLNKTKNNSEICQHHLKSYHMFAICGAIQFSFHKSQAYKNLKQLSNIRLNLSLDLSQGLMGSWDMQSSDVVQARLTAAFLGLLSK